MSDRYLKDHLHTWLEATMAFLEKEADQRTRTVLLESCGRACARHSPVSKDAKAIKDRGEKIDKLLDKLSQVTSQKVRWQRKGETIQVTYEKCFCPLRTEGQITSPTFCGCSVGWLKEVFETALGKPANVELEQAIGQGDSVCRFSVRC